MRPRRPIRWPSLLALLAIAAIALPACTVSTGAFAPSAAPSPSSASPWNLPPAPERRVPTEVGAALSRLFEAGTGGVPGVSVSLISAQKGRWDASTGTSDGTTPLDPDATFGLASLTKTFIAAAILRLVDEGRLALDDPIDEHLPPDLTFDGGGTTIAHHLTMTSGITDPADPPTFGEPGRLVPPAEVLELVRGSRPEPGVYAYSNLSYYLLGLVLAEASGTSTAEALRDGVLADTAFARIVYQPDELPVAPVALPLSGDNVRPLVAEHGGGLLMTPAEASVHAGSGAMAAPADELALWWWELFRGDIVSPAALAAMTDAGEEEYGMGLFRIAPLERGDFVVFANGGFGIGDSSLVLVVPERDVVVAAVTNRGGDPRSRFEPMLRELAAMAFEG